MKHLLDRIVDADEAGRILGVTGRQVRNLINDGVLRGKRIGRSFAIVRADLAKVPKVRKRGPKPK